MFLQKTGDFIIQYNDVLTASQHENLFVLIKNSEEKFKGSLTTDTDFLVNNHKYRKSLVLPSGNFAEFKNIFKNIILLEYATICLNLKIDKFDIDDIEIQLTAHNDGDYYLWHKDTGEGKLKARVITFVYYFHREPKQYSGGELGIYPDHAIPVIVTPENNSMVFFNSSILHEVKPVICPGGIFENGRFTLNGWIKKKIAPK